MARTIMLLPIKNSVGFTSCSISLLKSIYQKKINVIFFKPFSDDISSDSSYSILRKYFTIPYIYPIVYKKKCFFSKKQYYDTLVKDNLELYYTYKKKYDIIFIEGKKSSNDKYDIHNLNLKFLSHIQSEIIFYCSQNNYSFKKFFFYKKKYRIEINTIALINNFCDTSLTAYNDIFFMKYFSNIKCNIKNYKNEFFTINIPWLKKLINFPIYKIFSAIKIKNVIKDKYKMHLTNTFILYNRNFFGVLDRLYYGILLISLDEFIKKYNVLLEIMLYSCSIHSIILTNCNKYDMRKFYILKKQINVSMILFQTELKIQTVISIIQGFKINIIQKQYYIDLVMRYISFYLNRKLIPYLLICKKENNTRFSPILFCKYLVDKVSNIHSHILLPEGSEPRIIHAASIIANLGIAQLTLLGNIKRIYNLAYSEGLTIPSNINIIDPKDIYKNYIDKLFLLRCRKGMTWKLSEKYVQDNMILAALLLHNNEVDGVVCGVKYTTEHVLRTAIQLIGLKSHIKYNASALLSSVFFMLLQNNVLLYSDCAVNINPSAQQLFTIAFNAASLALLFNMQPKIAMLSYSTGYSGIGNTVDKVRQATHLLRNVYPNLIIEGPIQYDAAINPLISRIKCPTSSLKGQANIFIFPDLNSGNIAYKAVQQSSNISSIGPILQGLIKPINDLSRGSTINDIVHTILVTILQSHKIN